MSIEAQPVSQAGAGPAPRTFDPEGRAGPVPPSERIASVDVLRGFALLGILAMNIVGFAWPFSAYENPTLGGGFAGADRTVWLICELVFSEKMMTIFSMLFGAGLILMTDRADARGRSLIGLYYRRCLWLLLIGMAHAYLLWPGDILVAYALCGMILFPFRR